MNFRKIYSISPAKVLFLILLVVAGVSYDVFNYYSHGWMEIFQDLFIYPIDDLLCAINCGLDYRVGIWLIYIISAAIGYLSLGLIETIIAIKDFHSKAHSFLKPYLLPLLILWLCAYALYLFN